MNPLGRWGKMLWRNPNMFDMCMSRLGCLSKYNLLLISTRADRNATFILNLHYRDRYSPKVICSYKSNKKVQALADPQHVAQGVRAGLEVLLSSNRAFYLYTTALETVVELTSVTGAATVALETSKIWGRTRQAHDSGSSRTRCASLWTILNIH